MNLKQIRDQIAFILDYDPDRQEYTDDLTEVINRNYLDLFGREDFSFAQKEASVKVTKPLTSTGRIARSDRTYLQSSTNIFTKSMEGYHILIDNVEYQIAIFVSSKYVYLTKEYEGAAGVFVPIEINHKYIDMPEDCVRILDVFRREPNNPEQMLPLSRSDEGLHGIDFTQKGEPIMWMPVDDFYSKPPITANFSIGFTTGNVPYGNRTIEYGLCYEFGGKLSPMSKTTELVLDNNSYGYIQPELLPYSSGLRRVVFVRNKSFSNKWYLVPDDQGLNSFDPSYNAHARFTLPVLFWNNTVDINYERFSECEGNYKRIRMYPAQDDDYTIYVRYAYRPKILVDDYDVPEFDAAYHKVLVFMAVREAFAKMNNASMAGMYASKVKNEMQKLSNGFLSQRQQRWIKSNGTFKQRRVSSKLVTGDFGTLP